MSGVCEYLMAAHKRVLTVVMDEFVWRVTRGKHGAGVKMRLLAQVFSQEGFFPVSDDNPSHSDFDDTPMGCWESEKRRLGAPPPVRFDCHVCWTSFQHLSCLPAPLWLATRRVTDAAAQKHAKNHHT
jgi:hypothetical protein